MDFGGLGGVVSGIMGFLGSEDTNAANAQQAAKQMDFQERMSNTSYQRAVADMQAAGLNPMLAYSQGGAGTPGGAMATMQNSAASGAAAAGMYHQQQNVRSDTELKNSQATLNAAETAHTMARTTTEGFSAQHVAEVVKALQEENRWGAGEGRGKSAFFAGADAQRRWKGLPNSRGEYVSGAELEMEEMRQRARAHAAGAALDEFGESAARRESEHNEGFGGVVRPWARTLSGAASSAAQGFRLHHYMRR